MIASFDYYDRFTSDQFVDDGSSSVLRIDRATTKFVPLDRKGMREVGFWERRDLQEMICRTPGPFCDELGERIQFVGSEIQPTEFVQDRIDLLGVDPEGSVVVVEIKRDSHKLQLLQALSYAGMISKWEPKRFIEQLCSFKNQGFEQAKEELEQALDEGDVEAVNRNQRIVLLAEAFDYEVLATAEWLTERYDVDIRCYRVALAVDGSDEFLTCTLAYPPPELTEFAIRRRRTQKTGIAETTNWKEALESIGNKSVVKFYEQEVTAGRTGNPTRKRLNFTLGGRIRFRMWARKQRALVYQYGRFEKDSQFWASRLGQSGDVTELREGTRLKFYLVGDSDFDKFKAALTELSHTEFDAGPEEHQEEAEPAME